MGNTKGIGVSPDWIPGTRMRFTQFSRRHFNSDYARREIEITKNHHCNALAFFVEMDGWLLYPSRFAEPEETIGKTDLFGEISQECKKNGIRLIAGWMGMHCQTFHLRQHPDWCLKHYSSHFGENPFPTWSAGEEKHLICLNSPFRKVLLGEVEEVLRNYRVDGIYFDGVYRMAGYCYCQSCREKFRQKYGKDVPKNFLDPEWRRFCDDYTVEFSRDVKAQIEKTSPEVKLFQDCHGTLIGTYDAQENIRGCSRYVDSFILECYHEYSGEAPGFVAMESLMTRAESHKIVSCARWLTHSPGHTHTAISEASALIWAYDSLATGAVPVAVDQEGFWYDHSLEKPLAELFGKLAGFERMLAGTEPLEHVALFHSLACKDQRIPSDNRSARASFEGYYLALEQNHIPFNLVTEQDILDGGLKNYACLVLPNIEFMDKPVSEKIKKFSAAGGGVVGTYRTSFCASDGTTWSEPLLSGLFGITEVTRIFSRGANMASAKYDAVSLTEPTNYFEVFAQHPITDGLLQGNLYNFAGPVVEIKPSAECVVLARLRNYNQKHAKSGRYFRWEPAEPAENFLFAQEGRSRTVYFAGALDSAFWQFGYNEAGRLLAQAARWSASRPSPEIDASPLLAVRIRKNRKKDITCIYLTNYATNQIFLPGFAGTFLAKPQDLGRRQKVLCVSPTGEIRIKMDVEKSPYICRSLTGRKLSCRREDGRLVITVPSVKEGEIIFITRRK